MKLLLVMLVLAAAPASTPHTSSGTIFVVRHAERASPTADALSAAGQARAKCLAATLRDAPISAVLETTFVRTQQTAAPTAKEHHVAPKALGAQEIAAIAAASRRDAHSGDVLVVGHGDTVPQIVRALTGAKVSVPATSYDQLFVIRDGALVTLHYCPASQPGPESRMMR